MSVVYVYVYMAVYLRRASFNTSALIIKTLVDEIISRNIPMEILIKAKCGLFLQP